MNDDLCNAKKNIRRFIAFRSFFNARFYYPVFTVIFLDFGLSLDQFALLNVIWAFTIIIAEVPSGALSDLIGRKKLVNLTAYLMVLEMFIWLLAPQHSHDKLFFWLAINRILSGLAEAAASGADEALVYDSMKKAGIEDRWTKVLDLMNRWKSLAFVITMITGAVVYDTQLLQHLCDNVGLNIKVDNIITLKLPLYLTLISGIICCFICSGMVDVQEKEKNLIRYSLKETLNKTSEAAKWIYRTPIALAIIVLGSYADGTIRMFITLSSEFYRLIQYPNFALGIIGSVIGLINIIISPLVRRSVENDHLRKNWIIITVSGILAFAGIQLFIPYFGLFFMFFLNLSFLLVSFILSDYINRYAPSKIRATVLSFKGLTLNLSYGLIGLFYAYSLNLLRNKETLSLQTDQIFIYSTHWFLPFYGIGMIILFVKMQKYLKDLK